MNLPLFSVIAFLVFVSDTNGQFGPFSFFGPPAGVPNGWMIGQEASKNAVNTAVNSALAKANTQEFSPELEVNKFEKKKHLWNFYLFICIHPQSELLLALAEIELALAACDELLLTSGVWRYKICKFQEISKLKAKIQELKLKQAAAAATSTTVAPTFPSDSSASEPSSGSA